MNLERRKHETTNQSVCLNRSLIEQMSLTNEQNERENKLEDWKYHLKY